MRPVLEISPPPTWHGHLARVPPPPLSLRNLSLYSFSYSFSPPSRPNPLSNRSQAENENENDFGRVAWRSPLRGARTKVLRASATLDLPLNAPTAPWNRRGTAVVGLTAKAREAKPQGHIRLFRPIAELRVPSDRLRGKKIRWAGIRFLAPFSLKTAWETLGVSAPLVISGSHGCLA